MEKYSLVHVKPHVVEIRLVEGSKQTPIAVVNTDLKQGRDALGYFSAGTLMAGHRVINVTGEELEMKR